MPRFYPVSLKEGRVPWWTDRIRALRQSTRRAERKWKSTKLEIFRQIYLKRKMFFHATIRKAKAANLARALEHTGDEPKKLWKLLNNAVGRSTIHVFPSADCDIDLAERFNEYFINKVVNIRASLDQSTFVIDQSSSRSAPRRQSVLHSFEQLTDKEVRNIIATSPTKSDVIDPIPTWFLKRHLNSFLPILTGLVNYAILYGLPIPYKHAVVRPLLKKKGLDPECLGNYRPVSALPFMAKVVERAVSHQLSCHLERSGFDPMQSAYRRHYLCETAITKLLDSVFFAADHRRVRLPSRRKVKARR